jgi:DNA replication protein DnaC
MCVDNKILLSNPATEWDDGQDFMCETHGRYRGKLTRQPFFGKFKVFAPACPKCEAEKIAEQARLNIAKQKEAVIQGLKSANIGEIYWGENFDSFDASTDELRKNLEISRNFAKKPRGKLVMLGNNGTGKTHMAVSILREAGGIIYTAYEIGAMLRRSYGGRTGEWDVLQRLCETPVLVIDEIGRTKASDAEMNWLSHVINKRHEHLLPLILISNRHLMKDCKSKGGCSKCLEKFFDNDVISRIIEDGILMRFTGEDYRYKKRAKTGAQNEKSC